MAGIYNDYFNLNKQWICYTSEEKLPVNTPITVTVEREEPKPTPLPPIKKVVVELSLEAAQMLDALIGGTGGGGSTARYPPTKTYLSDSGRVHSYDPGEFRRKLIDPLYKALSKIRDIR